MTSWLQAQLKAAENLLEAVDRTVSATTGAQPGAPGKDATSSGHHDEASASYNNNQNLQQLGPGTAQGPAHFDGLQQGSGSPLLAANVTRGLSWLAGSPKPSGSPALGSPVHPAASTPAAAAAAAGPKQPSQQLWQPFVPQPPSSGTEVGPRQFSSVQQSPGPNSPAYSSRASPAATPPNSTGGYTSRSRGPFSSSGASGLQPVSSSGSATSHQGLQQHGAPVTSNAQAWQPAETSSAHVNGDTPSLLVPGPAAATAGPATAAAAAAAVAPTSVDSQAAAAAVQGRGSVDGAGLSEGPPAAALLAVGAVSPPEPLEGSSSAAADAAPAAETSAAFLAPAAAAPAPAPAEAQVAAAAHAVSNTAGSSDGQQLLPIQQLDSGPAPAGEAAADRSMSTSVDGASSASAAQPVAADDSTGSSRADSGLLATAGLSHTDHSADEAAAAGPTSSAAGAAAAAAATSMSAAAAAAGSFAAKESQLTRLVETLRKRLEVVRGENQQLEDMLHEAEQRSSAEQATIAQLTSELTAVRREQDGLVSSAAANAAAQDAHIGRLQAELDAASRQVAALQAEIAAVQEQHAQALSSKDSMEGGALEALRAEVATYEGQLEVERRAHAATKAAAASRERDLEEQLGSSSEALAATQRQLEEASSRAREAEQQQLLAAAEAARLQQQVQQLGAEHTFAQQPDPHQQLQHEAEREAMQRRIAEAEAQAMAALQTQRAAEGRVAELQAEVAHLHSSYQAQAASRGTLHLEQQLRELQELLYQKQQQLERLSGEKQAQQLMLERQIMTLKSELGKAHAAAAASVTGVHMRSSQHDIIPMDALGEPYQRLARHNKLGGAVQATANFLDTTAASASQLLRQQPLARLIVFLYIVLIHLYVYFLLAHMQRQALLLIGQQEHATGVGPERIMQAPPVPAMAPPLPPVPAQP